MDLKLIGLSVNIFFFLKMHCYCIGCYVFFLKTHTVFSYISKYFECLNLTSKFKAKVKKQWNQFKIHIKMSLQHQCLTPWDENSKTCLVNNNQPVECPFSLTPSISWLFASIISLSANYLALKRSHEVPISSCKASIGFDLSTCWHITD